MLRAVRWILPILFSGLASAQVVELGTSQVATANAMTLDCNNSDGGAGAMAAVASCNSQGYTAVASAQAMLSSATSGGEVSAFAEGAATSTGSNANLTATGSGNRQAVVTWSMLSDTH